MIVTGVASPVTINFYALDLDTGNVQTDFRTASVNMSIQAYFILGNNTSGSPQKPFTGKIAAVAILRNAIPIAAAPQWAAAPWDFWYPPTQRSSDGVGFAGPRRERAVLAHRYR